MYFNMEESRRICQANGFECVRDMKIDIYKK